MNARHFIVTDTETSGLDPEDGCEVVQLSAKAYDRSSLTDHHAGEFNVFIKPQRPEKAQAGALKVIGPIWDKAMNEGVSPEVAYQKFVEWVKSVNDTGKAGSKPMIVGHNIPFDMKFINAGIEEYNIFKGQKNCPWHFNQFDTCQMTFMLFEADPTMHNYKLDSLLAKMNMGRTTSHHDAMDDVRLTGEAFVKILKWFRGIVRNRNK